MPSKSPLRLPRLKSIFFLFFISIVLTGCSNDELSDRRNSNGLPESGNLVCEDVFRSAEEFDDKFYDPIVSRYTFKEHDDRRRMARTPGKTEYDAKKLELADPSLSDEQRQVLQDRIDEIVQEDIRIKNEYDKFKGKLVSAHICYGFSAIHVLEACEETLISEEAIDRDFAGEICTDCYTKARLRHCEKKGILDITDALEDSPPTDDDIYEIFLTDPFLWELDEAPAILGDPCVGLKPFQDKLAVIEDEMRDIIEAIETLDSLIYAQKDTVYTTGSNESKERLEYLEGEMQRMRDLLGEKLSESQEILADSGYTNLKGAGKAFDKECGKVDDFVLPPISDPLPDWEPRPGMEPPIQIEYVPLFPDPLFNLPLDVTVAQHWEDTFCGGSASIVGQLTGDTSEIKDVRVLTRIGSGPFTEKSIGFDEVSGAFTATLHLDPGTYEYHIAVDPKSGNSFGQLVSTFTIEPCPDNNPDTTTDPAPPEDPDPVQPVVDPVPPEDPDTVSQCPQDDPCGLGIEYGHPVCDATNLPVDCVPSDNRDGWDCYTWEESACNPTTRCFCITPPEAF